MAREPGGTEGNRGRTLMLLGGNEWHQEAESADRWWLARAERPLVTVVTSAAQDIPDTQVSWAARHFQELGATVEGCQIQSCADAQDPVLLNQLHRASAIYLCGGDPRAAQEALCQTPAGAALKAAYRRGTPLAGSSAGAMVLGELCLLPGDGFSTAPGLGLFAAVVVPHWGGAGRRWQESAARLSQEHEVIAIDESTGACWDGTGWRVRGPGRAVVVRGGRELPVAGERPSPPVE
ncbi:MAG TPA: Type 1 glutamine amidotransferase-like domain-containing protein [Candidatus Dormibacteraeota bacterium]